MRDTIEVRFTSLLSFWADNPKTWMASRKFIPAHAIEIFLHVAKHNYPDLMNASSSHIARSPMVPMLKKLPPYAVVPLVTNFTKIYTCYRSTNQIPGEVSCGLGCDIWTCNPTRAKAHRVRIRKQRLYNTSQFPCFQWLSTFLGGVGDIAQGNWQHFRTGDGNQSPGFKWDKVVLKLQHELQQMPRVACNSPRHWGRNPGYSFVFTLSGFRDIWNRIWSIGNLGDRPSPRHPSRFHRTAKLNVEIMTVVE